MTAVRGRDGGLVRFNREDFGYLVAYSNGEVCLVKASAQPLLEAGVSQRELSEHLLSELDVTCGFHLRTPPLIWLELTRRCNLACPHCYIDGGKPRANELSTPQLHAIIDDLADMGVWAVAFTGGEPTLHPDFAALVRHARARELLVGIATHGLFLSRELLEELPKDGVIISVSLDDLHIHGKRPNSDFRVASQALLRARDLGFPVNIMTNTNRKNLEKLPDIMSWARTHDVSVRSVPFSPIGRGKLHAAELENTVADVEAAAQFWLDECEWEHKYHEQVGLCVGVLFNYGLSLAYMTRRCSSGRFLAYICSDGTVYPCTMCAAEGILSPGSVRNISFSGLWRTRWQIREFSWANFKTTCSGCVLDSNDYYCASRCPAMSHARNGELFGCGASPFEIASTLVRTAKLDASDLAGVTGQPTLVGGD